MSRLIITAYIILIASIGNAQKSLEAKVENISFSKLGDSVVINYDIIAKPDKIFIVTIEIFTVDGLKIPIRTLSGDIYEGVEEGLNKTIYWDYKKDSIYFDEKIQIEVIATVTQLYTEKLILKSAIYPGWGNYEIDKKSWRRLYGGLVYSTIPISFLLRQRANLIYESHYLNSVDIKTNEFSYQNYSNHYFLSNMLLFGGISLWASELLSTYLNSKKELRKVRRKLNLPVSKAENN